MQVSVGRTPEGWGKCFNCGSFSRLESMWQTGGDPCCRDKAYCKRARAVRDDVAAEFEALQDEQEHSRAMVLEEMTAVRAARNLVFTPVSGKCEHCGKTWEGKKGGGSSRKYCSPRCKDRSLAPVLGTCQGCGQCWTRKPFGREKRYCTKQCGANARARAARKAAK